MNTKAQVALNTFLSLSEDLGRDLVDRSDVEVPQGNSSPIETNDKASVFQRLSTNVVFGTENADGLLGSEKKDIVFGGDGADLLDGDIGPDTLFGEAGNDILSGSFGGDFISGGAGDDSLFGASGNDQLVGGDGIDQLTGGAGGNQFVYEGDVFANGTPTPAGRTGINVLNKPDIIQDFNIGLDQFVFDGEDLKLGELKFQKGSSAQIAGDSNIIVLTDPFPAAGAAARAIANNDNVTADEGVFVYFNSTLGLTRMAYSSDLNDGGNVSVLANLNNQRGDVGLANLENFSASNFVLG